MRELKETGPGPLTVWAVKVSGAKEARNIKAVRQNLLQKSRDIVGEQGAIVQNGAGRLWRTSWKAVVAKASSRVVTSRAPSLSAAVS
eukprot:3627613-Pleurochrysis_carterae.AAC.8